MLLSVAIPFHQQSHALRRTLLSLAAQSLPADRFEVIIADDCSPEPAAALVAKFADRLTIDCRRHEVNRGRAAARNTAAAAATGERLLFLDADSVAHPRLLERHLEAHLSGRDRVILGRRVEADWGVASRFDDPGRLPETVPLHLDDGRLAFDVGGDGVVDGSPWVFLQTHNFSLPRSVFEQVGGFDEAFDRWGWEDTELGYRLYLHWNRETDRFAYRPEAVCYHVPHYSDFVRNWHASRAGLDHLRRKHEHYEVERLGSFPRDQVLRMPGYAAFLHRSADRSAALAPELERLLPLADRRLWAGRGADRLDRPAAATLDPTAGRTQANKPLLGIRVPWPDGAFDDVVHWENWRVLSIGDLGDVIRESLRLAERLYLAGCAGSAREHGLAERTDALGALETSPFTVREVAATDALWVVEVRK